MAYTATLSSREVLNAEISKPVGKELSAKLSTAVVTEYSVLTYANIFEFPNRGSSKIIYVSMDDNSSYRWDEEDSKYFCIGRDYEEIEVIICGGSA